MTHLKSPIVAFAHHPWHEPEWMNRQQLLSRLGKRGWPVAYSYGALDWWQRGSKQWQTSPWFNGYIKRDHIYDIQPGRKGARWQRFPAYDRFATYRHARYVRSTVSQPEQRIIVMIFDPQFFPYIEYLEPCDVVFHAYDVFTGQPSWSDRKAEWQTALLAKAKLVTASSEAIARSLNHEPVIVLPNGADVDAFLNATSLPEPEDLAPIPHPRIGYVGAINRKVDLKLIAEIAAQKPEWHWVLVGRIDRSALLSDPEMAEYLAQCEQFGNVHFLGQKDRREVPAYVGNMDINAMCYRATGDGWWKAGYPLKLHEYLATGLPVISTPIESVINYSANIHIADDYQKMIKEITTILNDGFAKHNELSKYDASKYSWDTLVIKLEKLFFNINKS